MRTKLLQWTKGFNAEGLFAPLLPYATETPFPTFVTTAAEGKLGVYNAATGALITGAIGADVEFFIALKRDGFPATLTKMKKDSNLSIVKTVGVAGVNQVVTVVVTCGGVVECSSCGDCCADETKDYSLTFINDKTNDFNFENYAYDLTGRKGKKIKDVLNGLQSLINNGSSLQNSVRDGQVIVMSNPVEVVGVSPAPSTYTFTLTGTGVLVNRGWKLAIKGFCDASVTYTTVGSAGTNALYDMVEQDRETLLYSGWGTEVVGYPFESGDFGNPSSFTKLGSSPLYTVYNFTQKRYEASRVIEQHVRFHQEILGVPTGSALETSLNTIFGV